MMNLSKIKNVKIISSVFRDIKNIKEKINAFLQLFLFKRITELVDRLKNLKKFEQKMP